MTDDKHLSSMICGPLYSLKLQGSAAARLLVHSNGPRPMIDALGDIVNRAKVMGRLDFQATLTEECGVAFFEQKRRYALPYRRRRRLLGDDRRRADAAKLGARQFTDRTTGDPGTPLQGLLTRRLRIRRHLMRTRTILGASQKNSYNAGTTYPPRRAPRPHRPSSAASLKWIAILAISLSMSCRTIFICR